MTDEIVPITASPVRRSGASNLAPANLQSAFIESARTAMGQPDKDEIQDLLGLLVTITFNGGGSVTGTLTRIIDHPSSTPNSTYLILDDDEHTRYALFSIQSIEEVEVPEPPELNE